MRRVAGALLALALLAGCADRTGAPVDPAAPAPREYRVRAEVIRLPAPGAPVREITVRHEAIPGFVGQDGQVVGMPAMVMPLEVAPGVSLDGVAAGSVVELILSVDWTRGVHAVRGVQTLPAGTRLDLGPGR